MALENSMLVMNGKQVGGNTQDLTGYQTKVDNNLETESKEIVEAINELKSEKTDTDMVAADFNAGTSYTAGNYCIYEGKFYKFKANHSGAWSVADVDEIKIAGELSALKSGLTDYHINTIYDTYGDIVMVHYRDNVSVTNGVAYPISLPPRNLTSHPLVFIATANVAWNFDIQIIASLEIVDDITKLKVDVRQDGQPYSGDVTVNVHGVYVQES